MVASLAREELCQAGEGLFNPISRHRQVYIDFQVFIYWICAPYRFFGSFIGELKYGKRQARLETRSAEDRRWPQVISQMEATFHAIIRRFTGLISWFLFFWSLDSVLVCFSSVFFPDWYGLEIRINICCKISLVQLYVPALGIAKDWSLKISSIRTHEWLSITATHRILIELWLRAKLN